MIIGIIGGGQLGMMMTEPAHKLGHKIIGLDPTNDCPLSFVADDMIIAQYDDVEAFENLVDKCDVITYEFENVNLDLVEKYITLIPQKSKGLKMSKDRLVEKKYARSLGIDTVGFKKIEKIKDLYYPAIVKTTTGGYDGKGQFKLSSKSDIDHIRLNDKYSYIIEELIEFDYEISVVCTRDCFGNVITYPISKNYHRNGILHTSEIFNDIDPIIQSKAKEYTQRLVTDLDYVGTFAVEYFVVNNKVIFNEFAPRPHNSGHYTIEGATVSQFTNHIHAITGQKVIESTLVGPTIMINVLGQDTAYLKRSHQSASYVHLYHKSVSKIDRKMGHITIVSDKIGNAKIIKNHIIKE